MIIYGRQPSLAYYDESQLNGMSFCVIAIFNISYLNVMDILLQQEIAI